MNPKVAAILQALAPALEAAVADAATAVNPALGAVVTVAEAAANSAYGIGSVPANAGGVLPHVDDPKTHPVVAASGRAPQVPQSVPKGSSPAEDDMNFPDIYSRLAAVEAKLNALVAATGLAGSAAMAAHP